MGEKEQIQMGIKVEKEHAKTLKDLASDVKEGKVKPLEHYLKNVAKDHIEEVKDYYTRLKTMEEKAKVKKYDLCQKALKKQIAGQHQMMDSVAYKECVSQEKRTGSSNPYAVCQYRLGKRPSAGGAVSMKSESVKEVKEFDKPKKEALNLLGMVERNPQDYKENQEGAKKENAIFSKADKFGNTVRQHLIDKVHTSMKQKGISEASPNLVSDHAHNMGIKLKSHEVVHASDTYEIKKSANPGSQMPKTGENSPKMVRKVPQMKSPQRPVGVSTKPTSPKVASPMGQHKQSFKTPMVQASAMKSETTGHERGVHIAPMGNIGVPFILGNKYKEGSSKAGVEARSSIKAHPEAKKEIMDRAKGRHRQVLSEIKQMPKPNLPKSETVEKAKEESKLSAQGKMMVRAGRGGPWGQESGVNFPGNVQYLKDKGVSVAGHYARQGDAPGSKWETESGTEVARRMHQNKLDEIKQMPKPNLPKSETAKTDIEASPKFKQKLESKILPKPVQMGKHENFITPGISYKELFKRENEPLKKPKGE